MDFIKNWKKLTCVSAEIAKTANDQIKSRILESIEKKTILVTGEMFRWFFLYAPRTGLKQANTEYKNEKIMMR